MGALDGIVVLDLSRAAPGPYCTMLMADMGADVLLVEEAGRPQGRRAGAPAPDPAREAEDAAKNALRRGKRSIRLNLKDDAARAVFHKLAHRADVVIEGFRPGVVRRLGIDYDSLCATNPRLVYCSLSGYGQDGPYAALAGHDIDYIAVAGALGIIGRPGTPPAIPLNLIADYAGGGLMAAFAIMAALFSRERTGQGQYVDIAMTDGVLSLLTRAASHRLAGGPLPVPGRDRLTGGLPHYNVYACKDGKYLAVGSLEPWFHASLCRAVGEPDLVATGEGSSPQALDAAHQRLRTRFLERTRDEWVACLREADACAAPVYDLDEALNDPHHLHRAMVVEVDHPKYGKLRQVGIAPKLSRTPGAVKSAGPRPGEHTDAVLGELGYDTGGIARLHEAAAVA